MVMWQWDAPLRGTYNGGGVAVAGVMMWHLDATVGETSGWIIGSTNVGNIRKSDNEPVHVERYQPLAKNR